jgi:low affinity Fe/Cu permease
VHDAFNRFARRCSEALGSAWAFVVALVCVLVWAASGPLFHWSDTYQLVINTGTTIITFLMVFIIQNTQNRDNAALHLKLDELLAAHEQARSDLLDVEHRSEAEVSERAQEYARVHDEQAGS